jgi:hypothetical protein
LCILFVAGFLRRCLTQQSQIREKLYCGLYEIFKTNPTLHDIIFEIFLPQFMNYFDPNPEHTPIDLKKCIEVCNRQRVSLPNNTINNNNNNNNNTNISTNTNNNNSQMNDQMNDISIDIQIREPLDELIMCISRCLIVHYHPQKKEKPATSTQSIPNINGTFGLRR